MADVQSTDLLERLGLKEYEASALEGLFRTGRTTAPNLCEATGIPQARIYGVLEDLADEGYVEIIPGRPKEYQPKPPGTILERADENRRQQYERFSRRLDEMSDEFLSTFGPLYEASGDDTTVSEELFYVVDVGEPSERETRRLYDDAGDDIYVLTKSFEYFPAVESAFGSAVDRGIDVRVLFLHPSLLSDENRSVQVDRIAAIERDYPAVEYRYSDEQLPFRGTLADPSMDYDSGQAIFLVEEKDVPLHMRQAAVTENGSLVAGMLRYFELIWEYESTTEDLV